MSYTQLDSLKLPSPLLQPSLSPTSPLKKITITKSKRNPRKKRDTLELIFPSKDPLKTEPDHSPTHPTDSDYIFLGRKKAIEFLKTDHMIKHSRSQKRSEIFSPKEKKPDGQGLTSSPRLQSTSIRKSSMSTAQEFFTFSDKESSVDSPTRRCQTKAVYDNLISAVENHSIRNKYNPLSARSLTTHQTLGNDNHTERIKALQHRIYGMDHFNNKKINSLLHQQVKEANPSSASPLLTPRSSRTNLLAAAAAATENRKKNLPAIITNISLKKVLEDKEEEHEEIERNKISDYYIYDYDNLNNEYHFTDPDMSEYHDIIKSLTSYQAVKTKNSSPSPHKEERMKSKSHSLQKPLLRIKTDQYFDDDSSPQEAGNNIRFSQKKEAARKLRLIPKSPRKEENFSYTTKAPLVNKIPGKAVLNKSPTEPSLRLFGRRTMTESYSRSNTTRMSPGAVCEESGMKNLEKLCLQFGKQNKRMLKNFEKTRMEATKDYEKLGQKMETIKPYWLVEGN